jgi:hypothetical protein
VERLMRARGWRGVTRARKVTTTVSDPAHSRAPDLVNRNFTASRPGELHVADFTYVPLDGGSFGYSAFCIDAFAGLIAGWECSLSKETAFVERAIRQAASLRARQGQPIGGLAIHHSDAGSQGGFNWSSQRLDPEELRCESKSGAGWMQRAGSGCGPRVARRRRDGRSGSGSGRRSRAVCRARTLRSWPASRRRWARGGSVNLVACRRSLKAPCRGATCP